MVLYLAIFLFIVAFDQITKILITSSFDLGEGITIFKDILSFTYVKNEGAAFGIMEGARIFFIILTVVVLIAIILYFIKARPKSHLEKTALVFLAGGAAGNFIDRVAFGYVRDFISADFINFPVFNIADCFVCIGAGLYVLYTLLDLVKGKKTNEQ